MLQYTLSEQLRYVIVDYVIMLCIYICCVTCNKISSVILYTRVVVLYIYILKHLYREVPDICLPSDLLYAAGLVAFCIQQITPAVLFRFQ